MIWNVLCLIHIMMTLDDKSFAFDFTYNNERYNATCIAQVIKINDEYRFLGTYQVRLHDFTSRDASLLFNFNELTYQWDGTVIDTNETIQADLIELIAEEIAGRYK
ncbi:MAG: hypothetical protein ABI402_08210 [Ferruginibacter sp.]